MTNFLFNSRILIPKKERGNTDEFKKTTLIIILGFAMTILILTYFINYSINKSIEKLQLNIPATETQETNNNTNQINKEEHNDKENSDLDNNDQSITSNKGSNKPTSNKKTISKPEPAISSNESEVSVSNKEEEVLTYFRTLEAETQSNTKESQLEKVKDKLDKAFFTTVDFVFYNKEIKGITFNELSDKAKIEILEITSNIDSMIIKKFPNYKETIKSGGNKVYNIVSEQSKNLQNTIKNKIGDERYNNITDNINRGKNKIVDIKDNVFSNIKNWYEKKRDN